ncbi:MAG TPA: GntR family transcriptional regulator [Tistrella mobilis]|uniref:GntR family transcriptional regulator n=1 Tax=Tistrella mobilis TaxID=171437 RepID=A0A3B9II12_9PROT|nr:GntR family transcriptional regulator [Tistrella mobilis]
MSDTGGGIRDMDEGEKVGEGGRAALGREGPTPLYHRLYVIFREKILGGELRDGDVLPAELDIARDYGVSRITAKRALDDLAAEGLVSRQRGRGTMVTHHYRPAPIRAPLDGLIATIQNIGARSGVRLVSLARVAAPAAIAEELKIDPGTELVAAERVRSADGRPFALLATHTLPAAAAAFTERSLAHRPRLGLFEEAGFAVAAARQKLSAQLADDRLAVLLEVEPGAALLRLTRTMYDQAMRPFDHLVSLYVPGRFEYRMDLTRSDDEDGGWKPARLSVGE